MALRLLVFDRAHVCVHDRLFVDMAAEERADSMRLVMGMCHSLRAVLARMSDAAPCANDSAAIALATSAYGLHYWEAPAGGWRVVLLVRAEAHERARDVPAALFAGALVPSLARSPLAPVLYPRKESGRGGGDGGARLESVLSRTAHREGAFDAVPGLRERSDAVLRARQLLV